MNEANEKKLFPELNWLYNNKDKSKETDFRFSNALNWSKKYIASLYHSQNNIVFSELFDRTEHFYENEANLEKIKAFHEKQNKSQWERLAQGIYEVSVSEIYEYQSMMSTYRGDIDLAISYMEKSEKGKEVIFLGNPFSGKIKDCHDCDHAAPQHIKYTKLSFLKKIKEMQINMDKGLEVYNHNLVLGHAFYNITQYGNGRTFYYGNISNQYSNDLDPYYQPYLLNCSMAYGYYKKAFDTATDPEQKAKSLYMMAKCERNDFYTAKNNLPYNRNNDVDFLAWNGFKKLKSEYSNTQYYRDVIAECGYFKTYVGMK